MRRSKRPFTGFLEWFDRDAKRLGIGAATRVVVLVRPAVVVGGVFSYEVN